MCLASAPMRRRPDLFVFTDVIQIGNAVDVDQDRRRRQAQLHERQQAVAAGQHLGVAVRAEQIDGFAHRADGGVPERLQGSCVSPPFYVEIEDTRGPLDHRFFSRRQ